MLKMNTQSADVLLSTSFDNSKVISSNSRNNKKLVKSIKFNSIMTIYRIAESSFLISDARQTFTQLR